MANSIASLDEGCPQGTVIEKKKKKKGYAFS